MRVVLGNPPLIDEIDARFRVRGKPIIFSWGSVIYNPQNIYISGPLMKHEEVHGRRQGSDVEAWWREYIRSDEFRLEEEVLAHVAEYQAILQEIGNNRLNRRKTLVNTAVRLSNPVYDFNKSATEMKRVLREIIGR